VSPDTSCTAFIGDRLVASGPLREVARAATTTPRHDGGPPVIFDDQTGEPIEIDLRGSVHDVLGRLACTEPAAAAELPRGPGRPRLGVVAREVTLLPRHWEWLGLRPGGASVTLRKLVEEARRTSGARDRIRQSQNVAYRFMSVMAGDLPGFEEATRALFAGAQERFEHVIEPWPHDVRAHARKLAAAAFGSDAATPATS
jgi:uncharacterized protein